ncbi:hypothetical protein PR202_ga09080 [Eleusine coracana subsp. coracana]|uniref:WRKY domain-containing protein n=1 Tax=Eleusine coracana subsp. coracana TaxID=191504 RepID=A0AAV5C4B2_ELECO|nr:hypothetical protein PR202_ga09080 [Eleusine coracana subsp. coracana]
MMHNPFVNSGRFGAASRSPESNNKYTTKVRSCAGKTPSDGFKWRKYGQKSIKNNPYPRYAQLTIQESDHRHLALYLLPRSLYISFLIFSTVSRAVLAIAVSASAAAVAPFLYISFS